MQNKYLYNALGFLAFLTALATYLLTVQPTVPFWDCGEFSAASVWQQVPHPPGAPLFLMIGKFFHTIIPFGDDGWRINLVSVLASAFTIWLLYIITVKVIFNFRKNDNLTFADELAIYGSAFIGALAFTFSDTFWFNAVESEVYAASTLFVSIVVYLMMRWNEEADNPGHEKYLLLIAYLLGLSTGVHLLAILSIFSIVLLVYFRKYNFSISSFIKTVIIGLVIFGIIYPGIVKWFPAMINGTLLFKNDCREYIVEHVPLISFIAVLVILFAAFMLWYSHKKNWDIVKLITGSFLLMLIGYSTYTQILLRSNANPPMNENEPKNLSSLTSYLGREQYGEAPVWPRRYQTDEYYYQNYLKKDASGNFVYGEWYPPDREDVRCKDETKLYSMPKFTRTNFSGEINYLFKYQIYHMYIRYFLWNFMGRASDIQDAPAVLDGKRQSELINFNIGYKDIYPIRFWAIPLLFGFIGLFFHFSKDPKMATVYLLMFLFMGVLAAIQQNQQDPQPRERDYFYTGSFLVWCLWIGLGTYTLIDQILKQKFKTVPVISILIISLILVPVNMAAGGWKMHSRAGNFLPFDYSYNILQSCEKDAILFTNGDNDTFPLWYLQDVAGVRRDIRIVNLSLGNTLWYIHQLKNRSPWGAKPIPLSFTDESLTVPETDERALTYEIGPAQQISIPVPRDIMEKYTNDFELLKNPEMTFTFVGKPYFEKDGRQYYLIRVQDKLILDILKSVKWRRPVYFSTTVGYDAYSGLQDFFRVEGMAQRICPVRQSTNMGDAIDEKIMEKHLLHIDNSENYHKEPHFGMKLRNLNNMDVFYDDVHRRLMFNYRSLYTNYAAYYISPLLPEANKQKAIAILDTMNKYISPDQFPLPYEMQYKVAMIYSTAGAKKQTKEWAERTINTCMKLIEDPELSSYNRYSQSFDPYIVASYMYKEIGKYKEAKDLIDKYSAQIENYLMSTDSQQNRENYEKLLQQQTQLSLQSKELELYLTAQQEGVQKAIEKSNQIIDEIRSQNQPYAEQLINYIENLVKEIKVKYNFKETLTDSVK